METFWIAFIFASLIISGVILCLLKWLKTNYPQAYDNDPAMASLGGVAAMSVIGSSNLSIEAPFNVVIGMLPIYLVVCFLLSEKNLERIKYIGSVALAIALTILIKFIAELGNWFIYSSLSIVFSCLWVLLFRARYVLKNNN